MSGIHIRLAQEQKNILLKFCKKYKFSITNVITISFFEYIKNYKHNDKEIIGDINEFEREVELKNIRKENRKILSSIHFVKNWNRRLLDTARHSLFNNDGHHFDIGIILVCLKILHKEHSKLPKEIKREIDIKQFDNWKSEVYIRQKLGILKSLPQEEARRITGK